MKEKGRLFVGLGMTTCINGLDQIMTGPTQQAQVKTKKQVLPSLQCIESFD